MSQSSAAEAVQSSLRQKITEGKLLPGSRLVDAALADDYGVSRNTIRDALRLLSADGLVVSVRNAGSSVRALTAADILDIYASRRLIETGAVLQSARASDELLAGVGRAAAQTQQFLEAGEWNRVGTASLNVHLAIVRLAGSDRINAFFSGLAAQLRLAFAVMPDESAFQIQWVARDREIADLIITGQREAAVARLSDYLSESETLLIDGIRAAERNSSAQ